MLDFAFEFEGNGDAVLGEAMDEVGSAVQWVDDPLVVFTVATAFEHTGFFSQNAVVRVGLANHIDDARFCSAIHFGDEVVHALFRDRHGITAFSSSANQISRLTGGSQGDIHLRRMHGIYPQYGVWRNSVKERGAGKLGVPVPGRGL